METISKAISGLKELNLPRKQKRYFTDEQKHMIIQEMLSSGQSKRAVWKKYTGNEDDHGYILRWMRILGYYRDEKLNFVPNSFEMKNKDLSSQENDTFESLQLKKRIEELEKQLKDAEMKAIAFSTMIDIAEKNLNISIRKKVNTKPLKK